jgi:hypothetical protein
MHLILENWSALLFFVLFVGALGYAVWLRWRMTSSKARFAFASLGALLTCLMAFMALVTGPLPLSVANAVLRYVANITGNEAIPAVYEAPGALITTLAFFITVFVAALIARFAGLSIRSWEGPVTVAVNDLARENLDNNLIVLALTEARLVLSRKKDPPADQSAIGWQQKLNESPSSPLWKDLSRDLFLGAYNEAHIPEREWRDRSSAWLGEIYLDASAVATRLILLVFDEKPTVSGIASRLKQLSNLDSSASVFAVYDSNDILFETLEISTSKVEIRSKRSLLRLGMQLDRYARDLIRQFEETPVGGTDAKLAATYVPIHVSKGPSARHIPLEDLLHQWLKEPGRRQLAITGEYGQGKSTAMLQFCAQWAYRYVQGSAENERVPLLIELRGKSPGESDVLGFLASWAGRYKLSPDQVLNLIRSGDAVVILEGFDELRNAGRAYDRHEHFNSLWRLSYPGTKMLFTGRPNFFLDQMEKNRTLRSDPLQGAATNAFTEVWELDRLSIEEIAAVCKGFSDTLAAEVTAAANEHTGFYDIVSRPSMIPVVATIWPKIQEIQHLGGSITGALLIEYYLSAIYHRKEEELERDRLAGATEGSSYLLLPREVREALTLAVVWRMAGIDSRNTIARSTLTRVIAASYDSVFISFKAQGAPPHLIRGIMAFEAKFKEESKGDRIERITSEIASSGLFVPDPAGGSNHLRLPHKQYYEYLIAKAFWLVRARSKSLTTSIIKSDTPGSDFDKIGAEKGATAYLLEIIGDDFSIFHLPLMKPSLILNYSVFVMASMFDKIFFSFSIFKKSSSIESNSDNEIINAFGNLNSDTKAKFLAGYIAASSLSVVALIMTGIEGGKLLSPAPIIFLFAFTMSSFSLGAAVFLFASPARALRRVVALHLLSDGVDKSSRRVALPNIWLECAAALNRSHSSQDKGKHGGHAEGSAKTQLVRLIEPAV